jgi:hypothetical protein
VSVMTTTSNGLVLQGRRQRRADRRRLKRQDVLSARLAELSAIRTLLGQATAIVERGWVQRAWFTVSTPDGPRVLHGFDLRQASTRPVTRACLVGAVVQAGGGPAAARSQSVQRALDLTWHTLREDPQRPVRWCPGPYARGMQVLDLTHWNDAPARTRDDVVGLLAAAQETAETQRELCLAERAGLDDATHGSLAAR